MQGYIHQFESFGCVDGPGSRFIVFLSGCPMRCLFCHNPDTWNIKNGKLMEASDVLSEALTCRSYWGKKGGLTVSGGEPLVQLDFLLELFTLAKEKNVNTCIDTSGAPFTREGKWFETFKKLMDVTDILLMDIKHIDEDEHIKLTGRSGKNIKDMFYFLDEINKPIWIRHVLTPGITDKEEYLLKTRNFIRTLHNVQRVEILPYHSLGESKYKELGLDYALKGVKSPTEESIKKAKEILECEKYNGWKD